ncbi:hypothetical protein C8F01DRAFT_1228121 [Mycena amicta]|nr:hypothetical protein C8F01DRAFT_1228121 [Mycena amicta]
MDTPPTLASQIREALALRAADLDSLRLDPLEASTRPTFLVSSLRSTATWDHSESDLEDNYTCKTETPIARVNPGNIQLWQHLPSMNDSTGRTSVQAGPGSARAAHSQNGSVQKNHATRTSKQSASSVSPPSIMIVKKNTVPLSDVENANPKAKSPEKHLPVQQVASDIRVHEGKPARIVSGSAYRDNAAHMPAPAPSLARSLIPNQIPRQQAPKDLLTSHPLRPLPTASTSGPNGTLGRKAPLAVPAETTALPPNPRPASTPRPGVASAHPNETPLSYSSTPATWDDRDLPWPIDMDHPRNGRISHAYAPAAAADFIPSDNLNLRTPGPIARFPNPSPVPASVPLPVPNRRGSTAGLADAVISSSSQAPGRKVLTPTMWDSYGGPRMQHPEPGDSRSSHSHSRLGREANSASADMINSVLENSNPRRSSGTGLVQTRTGPGEGPSRKRAQGQTNPDPSTSQNQHQPEPEPASKSQKKQRKPRKKTPKTQKDPPPARRDPWVPEQNLELWGEPGQGYFAPKDWTQSTSASERPWTVGGPGQSMYNIPSRTRDWES